MNIITEAELECAVYGEGTVFPVRIALDAKFSALQAAIAAIVSTEQCTVAPRLVALYLAKTERGWVRSDAAFEDFLKQGRQDTIPYTKMIPNWKLNKAEYFGPEFRPGDDDIHVFLELPVPVPTARDESGYFITTAVQEQAKNAVFLKVADDDGRDRDGVGMGVFFTPTLAVTCDHNLNVEYLVGSEVPLALRNGVLNSTVVLRDAERDFAILQSPTPRPFLPSWSGNPSELVGRSDLVLASFRSASMNYKEVSRIDWALRLLPRSVSVLTRRSSCTPALHTWAIVALLSFSRTGVLSASTGTQ